MHVPSKMAFLGFWRENLRMDPLICHSSSEKPMVHWKIAKFVASKKRFSEISNGSNGLTFSGRSSTTTKPTWSRVGTRVMFWVCNSIDTQWATPKVSALGHLGGLTCCHQGTQCNLLLTVNEPSWHLARCGKLGGGFPNVLGSTCRTTSLGKWTGIGPFRLTP